MTRSRCADLVADKRAIILCGAGGVGKTSASATIALTAARRGRRVLVITIDPSRRLAEVLGVSRNAPRPVELDRHLLARADVPDHASLSAWMLDPKLVADGVVRRLCADHGEADLLLGNHIYKNVTSMIAGMQEYAAVEAVHHYVTEGHYDLVVLDTPPSRNALQFLDAPDRVGKFLNPRVLKLFMPGETSRIRRAARGLIYRILDTGLGKETSQQLQQFLVQFAEILQHENKNAQVIREFFAQADVAFLIVTSPDQEAMTEAFYFEDITCNKLGFHLDGYILNRSLAHMEAYRMPPATDAAGTDSPALRSALQKLAPLAQQERVLVLKHQMLLQTLADRVGTESFALALPYLGQGVTDMESLMTLSDALTP